MKQTRKFIAIFLAGLMLFALSSCAGVKELLSNISNTEFDAAVYVAGCIDSAYKNENSEDYLNQLSQKPSAEELNQIYEDGMDTVTENFVSALEIVDPTDEQIEKIKNLYKEIYKNIKYEIGEATLSQSGNYLVSVTIYPIDIFQNTLFGEPGTLFAEEYRERGESGEFDQMSEAECEAIWTEGVISCLADGMDQLGYCDPVTISVQINVKDGLYAIEENDWVRIDELMIQYE